MTKAYTYTVIRCDGRLEKFSAPSFFDPFEIADRLPHSQVYLHIKPKYSVTGFDRCGQLANIKGPAYVLMFEGEHYQVEELPANDSIGLKQWKAAKAMRESRLALESRDLEYLGAIPDPTDGWNQDSITGE